MFILFGQHDEHVQNSFHFHLCRSFVTWPRFSVRCVHCSVSPRNLSDYAVAISTVTQENCSNNAHLAGFEKKKMKKKQRVPSFIVTSRWKRNGIHFAVTNKERDDFARTKPSSRLRRDRIKETVKRNWTLRMVSVSTDLKERDRLALFSFWFSFWNRVLHAKEGNCSVLLGAWSI